MNKPDTEIVSVTSLLKPQLVGKEVWNNAKIRTVTDVQVTGRMSHKIKLVFADGGDTNYYFDEQIPLVRK